ncbi:SDR family oxidoreductase [Rhodococcus ruber]|uniref:3-oxoacyl-[acyl-carrier-protein] reductase MabA n=1 Tax=Rhodococcus ruber TaxID=1830 RepID=A0ABT4MEF1_9NOCA|nr:SDR family oxidoreductase [Rhodococcus ruber]MCZ4519358.1 SDR family oxidoreductase [Rhodococcus ruber]
MKLHNCVAVVTGSGRGIGREIALKLASEGARVVVNDLDPTPAWETVEAIRAAGGEAVAHSGSVTENGFADALVDAAVENFGGLDIVVNNAGYTWDSVIQKTTDEQFAAMIDVHLAAPFRILRAAQPVMSAAAKAEIAAHGTARCRKIVNISSVAGLAGNPGQAAYASAKAGVTGLSRTLAREWGRYNITVNTVAFGLISTRLTTAANASASIEVAGRTIEVGVNPDVLDSAASLIPLGRPGLPEEAAGAVFLLCTPEADYITGQTLVCGGGWEG